MKLLVRDIKNFCFILLILLPFLWPGGLNNWGFSAITSTITGAQGILFSLFVCIVWTNFRITRFIRNPIYFVFSLMCLFLIMSTAINGNYEYIDYFKFFFSTLVIMLSFQIAVYKDVEGIYLDIIIKLRLIVLIVSVILCLLYPLGLSMAYGWAIDGSYNAVSQIYFWGNKNNLVHQFLPMLMLMAYKIDDRNLKGFRNVLVPATSSVLLFILSIAVGTATGAVVFFLFFVYFLLTNIVTIKKLFESISYEKITLVYVVLELLIVVFQSNWGINGIISSVTGRSMNFTGRTTIWNKAIDLISSSPIIGYGKETIISHVGYYWYAHNLILDILCQGGILTLLCAIWFYWLTILKNSDRQRSAAIIACLIIFLITQLFESMFKSAPLFYLLFMIAYFSKSDGGRNWYE